MFDQLSHLRSSVSCQTELLEECDWDEAEVERTLAHLEDALTRCNNLPPSELAASLHAILKDRMPIRRIGIVTRLLGVETAQAALVEVDEGW